MINRKTSAFIFGLFITFYTGASVLADDTEIYTGAAGNVGSEPLVMFSIDYAPSVLGATVNCTAAICDELVADGFLASKTTTRLGMLQAVLKKLIDPLSGMKIGLMMSHNSENNCAGSSDSGCSGGGYVLSGFESISTNSWNVDTNKKSFFDLLDNLAAEVSGGSSAHTFQGKELFFEFFRYLTGNDAYSSHLGWTDYGTDDSANLSSESDKYLLKRDIAIEGISFVGSGGSLSDADKATNIARYNAPGTYTSPITADCQKIFTVNFLKGVTNQEDDADTDIKTGTKASGAMENINLTGRYNNFETVLEYLHAKDFGDGTWGKASHGGAAPNVEGKQNVTSFFVVDSSGLNTGHDWAKAGGTTAAFEWTDDPTELIEDLTDIFSQIISVSTTFTAASVPVSVLNRAQVIDNVYIALFRADPDNKKRWPGNIKRLYLDTTNGLLKDANLNNAVGSDGRILHSALTYWTDGTSLPTADPDNNEIEGKDGRAVQRGGAGQKIPGYLTGTKTIGLANGASARNVYYEPSSGTSLLALNVDDSTGTALQTDLGAADLAESKTLIKYIRGFDVGDEDSDTVFDEPRSWILGDPLHSRPLPINYGAINGETAAKPDIRLVFGANDGLFHMIRNTASSSASGEETWAFMPRATMGIVSDLKSNPASTPHPYGVDGAPSAYIYDSNNNGKIETSDGDKVWVFFGLRRGGRGYYALDISDPDSPTFKWSITDSTTNFSDLAYSFSQPRVGYMNWGSGKKPVIIFTGGYDPDKDSGSSNDDEGNAFFVVDADTGALIWKVENGTTGNVSTTEYNHADMDDSIPSTVSVVDTNGDGLLDRAYVGDTGGRVWRFDMNSTNRANWKAVVLANVGRHVSGADADLDDRRFFHRPDFIQFKDGDGDYDAVVIASGDRAHPKTDMDTENFIYVIKDRDTTTGTISASTYTHGSFFDVTSNCLQDSSCSGSTANLVNGWRMEFTQPGEKALATPTTLAKKIFATTYLPLGGPDAGTCAPKEGGGRLYAINLADGTPVNDYTLDGDITDTEDRFVELDSGGIPAEVVYVPFNRILKPDLSIEDVGVSGRWKTYWYKAEN